MSYYFARKATTGFFSCLKQQSELSLFAGQKSLNAVFGLWKATCCCLWSYFLAKTAKASANNKSGCVEPNSYHCMLSYFGLEYTAQFDCSSNNAEAKQHQ
ncbi:hypothetical protein MA16_Dca024681 [Dendrobium catenatum]|uniref:Uncharacterized protein n=1 Tax=Dendrobium catenatum TaxID=906689 RepID=A0A2I0WYJ1_9ASPA|nr:hypothetical protein MA16_Dca024681 [Dendrobium catenatum]